MRGFVLSTLLSASLVALGAGDRVQIVAGVNLVVPASDGTLFLLGRGTIQPTPGAYITAKPAGGSGDFVQRYDPARSRVVFATYLNFNAAGLEVDAKGAAYIIGRSDDPNFAITPGAFDRKIKGGEELVVAKLNPSGSAMDYVTLLGGSSSNGPRGAAGIAVAPDGSVFVTGTTSSADFPVTTDALQPLKPALGYSAAFLTHLSADGSRLLYSTFLGGSRYTYGSSVWTDRDGFVHVAGNTEATDFPTTPGSYTTPIVRPYSNRPFVARFDPGSRLFESISAFGSDFRPAVWAHDRRGRVAMFGTDFEGTFQATPDMIWPPSRPVLLVFDDKAQQPVTITGLPAYANGLGLADDGTITVVGTGEGIPVSATAKQRSSQLGNFILKLDATARRIIYGTYFDAPGLAQGVRVTPGQIYIAASPTFTSLPLNVYPPFEALTAPLVAGQCSSIYAIPNLVQQCGALTSEPWPLIYWDACDPSLDDVELKMTSPVQQTVATVPSGSTWMSEKKTTEYQLIEAGSRKVLGTERVTFEPASRCASVPNPKGKIAFDNPILSCIEAPLTGTETVISGGASEYSASNAPLEIRVGAPDGKLFAASLGGGVRGRTGDWVRNETRFYLKRADTGEVLATGQAFLLPIRSCSLATAAAPKPAMMATPRVLNTTCGPTTAVLAWYSGENSAVEIRESTVDGRTVARFNQTRGLLEVRPTATQTYVLAGYSDGKWRTLAEETVYVGSGFCFGR